MWSKLAWRLTLEGQATGRLQQIMEAVNDGVQETVAIPIAEQRLSRWEMSTSPLDSKTSLQQIRAHTSTAALQPDGQVPMEDRDLSVMDRIQRRLTGSSFWRFIGKAETLEEKRRRVMSGPIKKVLKPGRPDNGFAGGGWHGRPAKEGGGRSRNGLLCRALCFV